MGEQESESPKSSLIKDSMRQYVKNYLLSLICARCLMKPRQLVNREDLGRWIAQISEPISMIKEFYFLLSNRNLSAHLITPIPRNLDWSACIAKSSA